MNNKTNRRHKVTPSLQILIKAGVKRTELHTGEKNRAKKNRAKKNPEPKRTEPKRTEEAAKIRTTQSYGSQCLSLFL